MKQDEPVYQNVNDLLNVKIEKCMYSLGVICLILLWYGILNTSLVIYNKYRYGMIKYVYSENDSLDSNEWNVEI